MNRFEDLTNEELDLLIERIDERRSELERLEELAQQRAQEEFEQAWYEERHCSKCGSYLSNRERKRDGCGNCRILRR